MKYTSIDQWKSKMKQLAKKNNVSVQEMQQRFILEEFANKISNSIYKSSIILKGGFVVSALLGIDERKTRDIDFTFTSTVYNKSQIEDILNTVINSEYDSFFSYSIENIREEQVDDNYPGYVAMIEAKYRDSVLRMKIDISNNTLIYPNAIDNKLKSFINDEEISVFTYSIENIIAEKYETTLDRGEFNTRMRDLFDIYFLFNFNHELIDEKLLMKSIVEVSKDRDTLDNLSEVDDIISELKNSKPFNENFNRYKLKTYPNLDVSLNDIFEVFYEIDEIVMNDYSCSEYSL